MSKIGLIAKNEYRKRAGQKSFLIGTLLIPIAFAILIALTVFIIEREVSDDPLGFVDHSGLLSGAPAPEMDEDAVAIIEYPSEAAALVALENGEIQAYYVIPRPTLKTQKSISISGKTGPVALYSAILTSISRAF